MARAFLQKRWSTLLGSVLGLTCASFLFAQVFDTKDIAATFDREAYIEYKAREFSSINDLIRQYEADLNWWMPLALPDTDRGWWKQASFYSLSPFNPAGFPSDFVKGLVPVTREDVAVYPVSITENFFTRYREICNANGALIASVPPPARYNPRWFVYQNYPSLDSWALSESRKAEIIGIYDQARLTVKMDLILDDELVTLIMRRSLLVADAQAQKATDDVLARKGGGNELAMKRSLTAASNIVVDCVSLTNGLTLQISYPNDFTNRLEIYAGSDLLADTWTLADTGLLTAGTNAIFWTDTNAIAGVKYFNVGDAQTDTDNDGLVDAREKRLYHSNPNSMDSDNDGLVDGYSGIVPTNAYPSGVTTNGGPYVEGELTWGTSPALFDTDDDGMSDGWEVAHGHNPLDPNDPPNVRGTINYSGGQTGPVIVMAVETSDSWATNHSVRLNIPGVYRISNLTPTNYWLKAFVDHNGDASNGPAESWGVHTTSAIEITNKVVGIDISLADPDTNTNNIPDFWEIAHFGSLTNSGAGDDPDGDQYSNLEEYQAGTDPNDINNHPWNVSGTVFYTGPQTGTIWVIASASLENWTGVRSTSIAAPGAYTITHLPPNTNYWIRAWRDTDGDNAAAYFEANGDAAQNPIYLDGNCTNADLTLADFDSDGDGLPDWWAVRYGLNAFDGVRSDAAGWWKLDAANGTNVLDSSAYGNHGTLWNNLPNTWTAGVVSNGLRLNGTNSYVQLADNASLKPQFVSVALWLRPDRDYTNGSAAFFSKRVSGGSAGYNLGYENGKLSFTIYASGAKTVQLPCALSNSVWRHVAGTYGGQYQRLYVDGVLAVETNYEWGAGSGEITQNTVNPRLGATADTSPSNHFAGTLDDVLVFGQELSSNRVFGLYQEGADFDQDGLSNWREFQTGTCPTNSDTDGDGLSDLMELRSGFVRVWGRSFRVDVRSVPENLSDVTAISAGYYHCLALRRTGSVVAWGCLGGVAGDMYPPDDLTNAIAVAAGFSHSMALRDNGTVVCWGNNDDEQCTIPDNLTGVVAIAAGAFHNMALRRDGTVVCWGNDQAGQCDTQELNEVSAMAGGYYHSLYVKSAIDRHALGFGANDFGQCTTPYPWNGYVAVAAGQYHSMGLRYNGTVTCWGDNSEGQCNVPGDLSNVVAIDAGSWHSVALLSNEMVRCWGYPAWTNSGRVFGGACEVPPDLSNVVAIAAGRDFSMALVRLNPLDPDSDHDGLTDGQELACGSNPLDPDSDHDGTPDDLDAQGSETNTPVDSTKGDFNVELTLTDTSFTATNRGRAELRLGSVKVYVPAGTGAVSRTLPLPAGKLFQFSLLDTRPTDTVTATVTAKMRLNDSTNLTGILYDPSGIFYYSWQLPFTNAPQATTLTLPKVTICYSNTENEIGDVCLTGETSTFEAQAVVTPNVSGSLTWINKSLPSNPDNRSITSETVTFTPTGMTTGVTDTVTWHWYWGEQHWNNPFYSEPMTSTNAMGGYSWTGVLPLNCDDDNLSGVPDVSETTVAGEDDLVAFSMTLQGCSAWLFDHPATGLVTVAQTGTGETKVWRNATKTAAGGNPGPNAMCNGSTLFLEGKTKSEAVGDVQIGEQYGDVSQNNAYTVLRLDVFGDINHDDSVNKDDMTAARAQSVQGLIIGCGATNRVLVQLRTECALNSGTVTLSLEGSGAAGSVRLWESPTSYSGETPYLVSGQTTNWQGGAIRDLPEFKSLYVDATDGGSATLTYSYTDDSQSVGFNSWMPITVLEATLNELWETSNRVNQIFNPTPKDDPPPASSNKLYIVESPVNNRYHVTLDVNDQPASLRNMLMYAVYDGGTIVTYDFFPVSGPVDIVFDHTASKDGTLVDFDLKCGWDVNGNGALDSFDVICPINVKNSSGQIIGPAIVKGASTAKYGDSVDYVNNAFYDPYIPNAKALLHIFLDGNTSAVATDRLPTQTNTVDFDCYSDPFCVWLTHNAGAPFNSSGTASINQYVWGTNTSLADLTANCYQMKPPVQSLYNNTVFSIATAFFATNPVGTIATFPLDGTSYNVSHTNESPTWVTNYLSGVTVAFDEPLQYNGINDDINGTIGRGRVMSHTAQFTIEKKSVLEIEYLDLTRTHVMGVVEDLYDFNAEDQGAGGKAAIIQLGHGNGGYGGTRSSGAIFRGKIEIDQNIAF